MLSIDEAIKDVSKAVNKHTEEIKVLETDLQYLNNAIGQSQNEDGASGNSTIQESQIVRYNELFAYLILEWRKLIGRHFLKSKILSP
jgi:hypothetical protein